MAPKKTTTTNGQVRRSARLASREPSVASDTSDTAKTTISKKMVVHAATTWEAGATISKIVTEIRNGGLPSIQRLTKTQCEAVIVGLAKQNINLEHELEESQQQIEVVTSERDSARENAPKRSLRRDLTLVKIHENYMKKQVAPAQSPPSPPVQEAPTSPTPAAPPMTERREPQTSTTPSSWSKVLEYIPFARKRKSEDAPAAEPAPKRSRVDEAERTPEAPHTTPPPPPTTPQGPQATPVQTTPSRAQKTPRPAAKHPAAPSSLSTITEMSESSPMSATVTPYRVRRAAQLRAARNAHYKTPTSNYAWERRTSTPRPKEPNADARLAKLNRMRELQQQLDELKNDADIQEMEAQSTLRRKRVKIDNLAVIPHKRAGDAAGTFRVPDPDSDDEIEVDSDVSERSNMFEDVQMEQDEPKAPEFTFPATSSRPADYEVSEAFKEEAGRLFAEGLEAYMSQA